MDLRDRVVVLTGGAHGIGAALARRFADERPRGIVIGDVDGSGASLLAAEIGAVGIEADVAAEEDTVRLIEAARDLYGRVDLFCANAGVATEGGPEVPDATWHRAWRVNVVAHVHAVRHLLPEWLDRGAGYLLVTASAAGLLTSLGAAPYAVTKHAAVAFAEWLAVTYGDRGIRVSCLCPQGVRTAMLESSGRLGEMLRPDAIEPETVADVVVEGLRAERFLILPHPEVADYFARRATDHERWLAGMRRLQNTLET